MARAINFMCSLNMAVKIYGWSNSETVRSKESINYQSRICTLTDNFLEGYIKKYGRPKLHEPHNQIKLSALCDKNIVHFLYKTAEFLEKDMTKYIDIEEDKDLITIRDELLYIVNQILTLFEVY